MDYDVESLEAVGGVRNAVGQPMYPLPDWSVRAFYGERAENRLHPSQ